VSDDQSIPAGGTAPAIDGWFTVPEPNSGQGPQLIGSHCAGCGTYAFPPRDGACPNPHCEVESLDRVPLSTTGTLWSFAENHYAPPPPYPASDPFEPYALAAVELATEGMVILGKAAPGVRAADLAVGMDMELGLDVLYTDDDGVDRLVWVWAPVGSTTSDGGNR
jgi:uncharacterized OB-fold protein